MAVYESETRTAQPPALDTLGERVQRILQEAWEGAYTLRQEAEHEVSDLRDTASTEVAELREVASREAADIIDQATRRALAIRDETERRRQAYLQRIEQDRERAVSQITYLYDQRQDAIAELARLQTTVQAVVEEMARSPLGRPAPGVALAASGAPARERTPAFLIEDDPVGRPGRHSISTGVEPAGSEDRDDVTLLGDAVSLEEDGRLTEEIQPPSRSRSESLFESEEPVEEAEDPEPPGSGGRRTLLFDAEEEGWA